MPQVGRRQRGVPSYLSRDDKAGDEMGKPNRNAGQPNRKEVETQLLYSSQTGQEDGDDDAGAKAYDVGQAYWWIAEP